MALPCLVKWVLLLPPTSFNTRYAILLKVFTKQEYEVITKFIKLAKQVNMTICTDDLNINTNPDLDIFYSNKNTIAKIWSKVFFPFILLNCPFITIVF